jgi:hypothetical protein
VVAAALVEELVMVLGLVVVEDRFVGVGVRKERVVVPPELVAEFELVADTKRSAYGRPQQKRVCGEEKACLHTGTTFCPLESLPLTGLV